jgi:Ion channel
MQLGLNLGISTVMVALTTLSHFAGLLILIRFMSKVHAGLHKHPNRVWQASMILVTVFGLFALHTVQIWSYAALYRLLGELGSFDEALYFATVTFVGLGYGDVVLSPTWRVLSGIEGANGVILIAWSTAFLITVTNRLKVLEHDWLERGDR